MMLMPATFAGMGMTLKGLCFYLLQDMPLPSRAMMGFSFWRQYVTKGG